MNITKHIPNTITCLNLFSGCIACVMAFQGEYLYAALFIYLAAAFDFLDGMMARILNAYSNMGKELDSLADVISFGMAPGIMLFSWLQAITPKSNLFLPYIAFLIPVFSALRLAKFNIDTRQTSSFIGLPTPANAIFIASLISLHGKPHLSCILSDVRAIAVLILLLSFLLISELPMFSLKFKALTWKNNKTRYIFLILSFVLLAIFQLTAIPLTIVLFILMSLLLHLANSKKQ
jgi:CDP-diacylglycerol--serine O-phosphatidyltransferase